MTLLLIGRCRLGRSAADLVSVISQSIRLARPSVRTDDSVLVLPTSSPFPGRWRQPAPWRSLATQNGKDRLVSCSLSAIPANSAQSKDYQRRSRRRWRARLRRSSPTPDTFRRRHSAAASAHSSACRVDRRPGRCRDRIALKPSQRGAGRSPSALREALRRQISPGAAPAFSPPCERCLPCSPGSRPSQGEATASGRPSRH